MQPGLIFAPLIRVSTLQQDEKGESLHVQRSQLEQAIANMDGKIYQWYAGNEHATPEYERELLDQLMKDARQKKFDAVMVADISRWSRDNGRSKQDLDILKKNGIRFFEREMEHDLFNPVQSFMVGMGVEIGEFVAAQQSYKAVLSCIAKAKKGIPVRGHLPYGRTFDKKTGLWGIDPEKHALIKTAIDRYLSGVSMRVIAPMLGRSWSQVHYIFTKCLGEDWAIRFTSKKQNIDETVSFKIPPLVDDATIKKIMAKLAANKTFTHGHLINQYLLSRMIFCEDCGSALTGCAGHESDNNTVRLYYRHQTKLGCKKSWAIRADQIETAVFDDLYRTSGDIVKSTEAMQNAIPDPWKRKALEDQLFRLLRDLAKNESQRNNLIDAISDGTIPKPEAKKKLDEFREIENTLLNETRQIEAQLASIPSKQAIGKKAELMKRLAHDYFKSPAHLKDMTVEDKRAVAQNLFSGKGDDGKRYGVYISRVDKMKRFNYTIKGNFGEFIGYLTHKRSSHKSKLNMVAEDDPGDGEGAGHPRPRSHHHRGRPLFQFPGRGADALILDA